MSTILDSIYATMIADGHSYEEASQSVAQVHSSLSGGPFDSRYEYHSSCLRCHEAKRPKLAKGVIRGSARYQVSAASHAAY